MDTRKRNVLIGVGAAILVVVVILVVLMVSGGSSQDEAASKTDSAVAAASDSSSKDVGVMHASGDSTADNEVDASRCTGILLMPRRASPPLARQLLAATLRA